MEHKNPGTKPGASEQDKRLDQGPWKKSAHALRSLETRGGRRQTSRANGQSRGGAGVSGGLWEGCGFGRLHGRRAAPPHPVLSGAASHRLTGDLPPPPMGCPQTHPAQSTAGRPAAPGRGPSWLQATCSRQALGKRGGCGRGSSGAQAWQGEASIRRPSPSPARRTLPFSRILTQPPLQNLGRGSSGSSQGPTPSSSLQAATITASPPGRRGPSLLHPRCPHPALRTCGKGGSEAHLIPGER